MFKVDISAVGAREGLSYIHRKGAAARKARLYAHPSRAQTTRRADPPFLSTPPTPRTPGDIMPRLEQATRTGTPYFNVMDHRKDISKKWMEMVQGKQQALKAAA